MSKIGYKERIHFMNPLLSFGKSGKMSSSSPEHEKIKLIASLSEIEKFVMKLYCPDDQMDNPVLKLLKIILQVSESQETIEDDFRNKILGPKDIKIILIARLTPLLEKIRNKVPQSVITKAYHSQI